MRAPIVLAVLLTLTLAACAQTPKVAPSPGVAPSVGGKAQPPAPSATPAPRGSDSATQRSGAPGR